MSSTNRDRAVRFLEFLVTGILLGMFLYLGRRQYLDYIAEPTGTTLKRESADQLPFPGITICNTYYLNAKAFEDLEFPRSPFMAPPKEVVNNPDLFYDRLDKFGYDVSENLWKYYMTLESVMRTGEDITDGVDNYCSVGSYSCQVPKEKVMPKPGEDFVEIEVEGGRWTSRFVADSDLGYNHLCHTLRPNVTVDFSKFRGNSFVLRWNIEGMKKSHFWHIYLHDPNEAVVLDSHAIETLPTLLISNSPDENDSFDLKTKMKATIQPTLITLPSPSAVHRCEPARDYSKNLCDIMYGWKRRFEDMESFYKGNFTCQIPGIQIDPSLRKPVCKNYHTDEGEPLGLGKLLRAWITAGSKKPVDFRLSRPSIGIYKKDSPCLRRCSTYRYSVNIQEVSKYDKSLDEVDVYLYFSSMTIESWETYRLQGFFDFLGIIGGTLGLFLGCSFISLIIGGAASVRYVVMKFSEKFISRREKPANAKKSIRQEGVFGKGTMPEHNLNLNLKWDTRLF